MFVKGPYTQGVMQIFSNTLTTYLHLLPMIVNLRTVLHTFWKVSDYPENASNLERFPVGSNTKHLSSNIGKHSVLIVLPTWENGLIFFSFTLFI